MLQRGPIYPYFCNHREVISFFFLFSHENKARHWESIANRPWGYKWWRVHWKTPLLSTLWAPEMRRAAILWAHCLPRLRVPTWPCQCPLVVATTCWLASWLSFHVGSLARISFLEWPFQRKRFLFISSYDICSSTEAEFYYFLTTQSLSLLFIWRRGKTAKISEIHSCMYVVSDFNLGIWRCFWRWFTLSFQDWPGGLLNWERLFLQLTTS